MRERRITEDIAALKDIAGLLEDNFSSSKKYQLRSLVSRLEESITRELDYRQESANAGALDASLHEFPNIRIPAVYEELSTERVLTMEYVPHRKVTDLHPSVILELDGRGLADELFRSYLHQVVVEGLFHADPHPGNIGLGDDRRLLIMDFGMVERVSERLKPLMLKFVLAVSEGKAGDVARVAEESGKKGEDFDRDLFLERVDALVTENRGAGLARMSVGSMMQQIQMAAGEADLFLPNPVVVLGKTLMNLEAVVAKLDPDFNPAEVVEREGAKLLQRHSKDRLTLATAMQTLLDSADLAQALPDRVNRFTKRLADEGLTLKVEGVNPEPLEVAFQKVANRISSGLIIAALIIGASLLMDVDSKYRLLGYPALALVFFILAAFAGLSLLWVIFFRDK